MKSNKLIYGGLIVVICWLGFLSWKGLSNDKIAYVDTAVLLQKYDGFKQARAEFEKKSAVWKANSDTLMVEWERELKSYEKERNGMTAKEKSLKEQVLQNKQQQIQQYSMAIQQKSKEEEQKMTQTVFNTVNDYITEYGKKHGYTYVLGANGTGNILYAEKENNITDQILIGLNKGYKPQKK